MNISPIDNSGSIKNPKNVAFTGQKKLKDDMGNAVLRLTVPPQIKLEKDEYLGVELVSMYDFGPDGTYGVMAGEDFPVKVDTDSSFKNGKKNYIDINLKDYAFDNAGEFGYRFIVTDKDGNIKRAYDDGIGTTIETENKNRYTIVSTRQGTQHPKGAMMHIFTDSYGVAKNPASNKKEKGTLTPIATQDEVEDFKRTHFNRAGGTIKNITRELGEDGELSPYGYIMTTPLIGGGSVSSHGYHPKNHFKTTEGVGTKKDFMDLLTKCFDEGKGYVLDGAFTSQGYEGLQLNHAMKWFDSPFKDWFKVSKDNDGNASFKLAVLPDNANENAAVRIVNPKNVEGVKYDKTKPSYIQFYDKRLATKEQLSDADKLIDAYNNKNTEDPYEITIHQDAILPYYFEINPDDAPFKGKAYTTFKELEKSGQLGQVLSPDNTPFKFVRKGQQGGFTGWDGNVDLVKMNLSCHNGTNSEIEGSNQARNYMYKVARYWTEETRNAIMLHIMDTIRSKSNLPKEDRKEQLNEYFSGIEETYGIEKGTLGKIYAKVQAESRAIEKNIPLKDIEKSYNYKIADDKRDGRIFIRDEMFAFPLESLNMSPELLAVLSTPYITPRPTKDTDPAASNEQIYQDAIKSGELLDTMDEVYAQIYRTLTDIMSEIDIENKNNNASIQKRLLKRDNADSINLTPYGKYFISSAMGDIMTFFVTESLFEDTKYNNLSKDGKIVYTKENFLNGTYGNSEELTLKKLGISGANSSKEEAKQIARKMLDGIRNLKHDKPEEYRSFIKYLKDEYLDRSIEEYKMAEVITDQTGAGLNWRFDAAKDVADWFDVKDKETLTSETAWEDVIGFWTPFVEQVRNINDSSYIIGEVTSLGEFDNYDWGKYKLAPKEKIDGTWDGLKAERAYYEETGVTTGSNYNVYFGLYPKLFGKNIENGTMDDGTFRSISKFLNQSDNFINPPQGANVTQEFVQQSHIFLDNHDKPRAAHLMSLDSELFWSNFKDNKQSDIESAEKYLQRDFTHTITKQDGTTEVKKVIDDDVSSKAVAVAKRYYEALDHEAKQQGIKDSDIEIIKSAVSHLANGYKYKSDEKIPDFIKAESFGSTPFEITVRHVMEQAKSMGLKISGDTEKHLTDSLLKYITEPYTTKQVAIWEMMTGTTGTPTLFAGDELAQTGSERSSKNWDLGCRNLVRHDWLQGDDGKGYAKSFNKRLNAVTNLHKQKGMQPLIDGIPVVIPAKSAHAFSDREFFEILTPEVLLNGVKKLAGNENQDDALKNLRTICKPFIQNADKMSKDELLAELEKTYKDNKLKAKLSSSYEQIKKNNEGLYDWIKKNTLTEQSTEIGGVYKYNDKNEAVLSIYTNAYISEDPNAPLLQPYQVPDDKKPTVSDIRLLDKEGRLLDKEGTIYTLVSYKKNHGKYIDNTEYVLQKDGSLKNKDGKNDILDSTVTFFKKGKKSSDTVTFKGRKVYSSYTRPVN